MSAGILELQLAAPVNRETSTYAQRGPRVLFVDSLAEVGGLGIALLRILAARNESPTVPLYASLVIGQGDLPERVAALQIPVIRIPAPRFRNLRGTARVIRSLSGLIRKQQIDVVFSNGGHANLFARPAALLTDRPCVWWVHGWEPRDTLREPISIAHQLLSADRLLANSEWTARMLRNDFPSSPPIGVVRPGVDCREFRPDSVAGRAARRELGIGDSQRVVGMFGRLQPWKGQHIFLEAAAALGRRLRGTRFLVVGSALLGMDLAYEAQLRSRVASDGLRDCVLFTGERRDISALMNACDVVIHASVQPEPWGLVVAEAMSAGRPVIASDAGGPREMIAHGRTGILSPPGDPCALADALEQLLEDPALSHRLGTAARQHALASLDARHSAANLFAELETVHRHAGRR